MHRTDSPAVREAVDDAGNDAGMPHLTPAGLVAGGGEGGGDCPDAGSTGGDLGAVQLGDERQGLLLGWVGDQLAALGPVAERRRAVGVAATGSLVAPARGQAEPDHGALVVRHGAEDLSDQASGWVGWVIMQEGVLASRRGGNHRLHAPALGQQLFLKDEITGKAIKPVHHQAAGLPFTKQGQGLRQGGSVGQRPAHALIGDESDKPMSAGPAPHPHRPTLDVQAGAGIDLSIG